ncbi:hypothetical protein MK805_08565 [Shimazuella sp. AN120528]|uniref:hypothetical protein n=1 Tax=Shimazuella soli TaxID=1892854 RepID=UPI001F0F620C|nr:hypothetical protein [Shimazuella soli]MCH5585022.1 hypothetical protein [Shimazuella soli]
MRKRTIYDYYKHAEWFTNFLYDYHPEVTTIQQLSADIIRNYINYMLNERQPYKGVYHREKTARSDFQRVFTGILTLLLHLSV